MGTTIIETASSIFELIPNLFQSLSAVFWNAEAGTLTFVGTLTVLGIGLGLAFFAFGAIRGFMHLRG